MFFQGGDVETVDKGEVFYRSWSIAYESLRRSA